jgi:hypothetical protein
MPRKKKSADDTVEFVSEEYAISETVDSAPDTVRMIRPDKGAIDVPAADVERYKKSDWKIV